MPIVQGVLELQDENQTQPKGEFGTVCESAWNWRASLKSDNSGSRWHTELRFRENNHPVVPQMHAKFRVNSIKRSGDSRQGFAPYLCNIIPSATQILRVHPCWCCESVQGDWSPSSTSFQSSISRQMQRRDEEGCHGFVAPVSNFWWYQIRISNYDENNV